MPQMEVVQFNNPSNVAIMDEIRGTLGTDYQNRVPSATKAGLNAALNAMNQYPLAVNQFADQLLNLLGTQLIRSNSWRNPLAKYKVGLLGMQESFEEVAVGLLKAKVYKAEAEALEKELFGREPSNVQVAYHKVNREEFYKLTINRTMLERAFINEGGLSQFLNEQMESLSTSDNWDEFLQTVSTLQRYYDGGGFYELNTPDLTRMSANGNDAKQFLKQVRAMSDTLPFISTKFNARHMPRSAAKNDLELLTTPTVLANMDVEGLSAAFNEDRATISSRITVIPDEHVANIPGFQGILTTSRFWLIADKYLQMGQTQNPVGLYNNYFLHHQEVISASPFEPAILLTSEGETPIIVNPYRVSGINAFTVSTVITEENVPVTGDAFTATRGTAYLVATSATTEPTGGPNDAVTLTVRGNSSPQTRINQYGILIIGQDETATTVTVRALATDDNTYERNLTVTVTGPVLEGAVGLTVDEDPAAIGNTRKPGITPAAGGPVGTTLTVNNGSWDTTDLVFSYAWNRNGSPIAGATSSSYTTTQADAGATVSATITATRTGYADATATSNGVAITA